MTVEERTKRMNTAVDNIADKLDKHGPGLSRGFAETAPSVLMLAVLNGKQPSVVCQAFGYAFIELADVIRKETAAGEEKECSPQKP